MRIKEELGRKSIHFIGIGYIPFYSYFGKEYTALLVISLTFFAAFLEFLKFKYNIIPRWMLRDHEVSGIGSHLYTGISMTLITLILPMEACFVAIANGILGDGVAGIVKKYRSSVASPSMFASSLLLLIYISSIFDFSLGGILLGCLLGTLAERTFKLRGHYVNDNFSVPFVSSISYFLFSHFFSDIWIL